MFGVSETDSMKMDSWTATCQDWAQWCRNCQIREKNGTQRDLGLKPSVATSEIQICFWHWIWNHDRTFTYGGWSTSWNMGKICHMTFHSSTTQPSSRNWCLNMLHKLRYSCAERRRFSCTPFFVTSVAYQKRKIEAIGQKLTEMKTDGTGEEWSLQKQEVSWLTKRCNTSYSNALIYRW